MSLTLADEVKDLLSGRPFSISALCDCFDEHYPDEIDTSHDPLSFTLTYEDGSKLILAEKDGSVYYEVDNSAVEADDEDSED